MLLFLGTPGHQLNFYIGRGRPHFFHASFPILFIESSLSSGVVVKYWDVKKKLHK